MSIQPVDIKPVQSTLIVEIVQDHLETIGYPQMYEGSLSRTGVVYCSYRHTP